MQNLESHAKINLRLRYNSNVGSNVHFLLFLMIFIPRQMEKGLNIVSGVYDMLRFIDNIALLKGTWAISTTYCH